MIILLMELLLGFSRVFKITFRPLAAPTVIKILLWLKEVSNLRFRDWATASLTSS